jgi:protein tyrosine phosphatase (PTP) superfamily phosphohydrolase (DUF442 family)
VTDQYHWVKRRARITVLDYEPVNCPTITEADITELASCLAGAEIVFVTNHGLFSEDIQSLI